MSGRNITWTPERLRLLKRCLAVAEAEGHETFVIPAGLLDDQPAEFDRRYAKYLVEYLEEKLT